MKNKILFLFLLVFCVLCKKIDGEDLFDEEYELNKIHYPNCFQRGKTHIIIMNLY